MVSCEEEDFLAVNEKLEDTWEESYTNEEKESNKAKPKSSNKEIPLKESKAKITFFELVSMGELRAPNGGLSVAQVRSMLNPSSIS